MDLEPVGQPCKIWLNESQWYTMNRCYNETNTQQKAVQNLGDVMYISSLSRSTLFTLTRYFISGVAYELPAEDECDRPLSFCTDCFFVLVLPHRIIFKDCILYL